MMSQRRVACLFLSLTSLAVAITPGAVVIPSWGGWGTSIAWWGNTPFGNRSDIADALWSLAPSVKLAELPSPVPGLGLSIGRYNAGGCGSATVNGSRIVLSPQFPPFKQAQGFWVDGLSADPTSSSWDWSKDAAQVSAATLASRRGAQIEVFSNSPMWWMLVNRNPSGSDDGTSDNLLPQFHSAHATYMATVAAQLSKQHNWTLASVELFNEPGAGWWKATGTQEGCHFDPSTQAKILPLVRPALTAAGVPATVRVASSDESQFSQAIDGWRVLDAAGATQYIDTFNCHGYEPNGDRATLKDLVNTRGGKDIRLSEHGEGDGTGGSLDVISDVYTLNATSWVYWQMFDGGGWATISSDVPNGVLQQINPKYWVLMIFTRHVRPGAQILASGDSSRQSLVAYDASRSTLVLISQNLGGSAGAVSWELASFGAAGPTANRWCSGAASGGAQYAADTVAVSGGSVKYSLPAKTVCVVEVVVASPPK